MKSNYIILSSIAFISLIVGIKYFASSTDTYVQTKNERFSSITYNARTIATGLFTVEYSEELEQPVWLQYEVLCPKKGVSRSGMSFRKPSYIKTSDNLDYENNDWDKGHLAPSASFDCNSDTLKSVYTYLNCVLQHKSLNRGPWAQLEEFERDLAKLYDKVYVEVECHFSDTSIVLSTGATVPDAFTKTVSFEDQKFQTYFINRQIQSNDWSDYLVD